MGRILVFSELDAVVAIEGIHGQEVVGAYLVPYPYIVTLALWRTYAFAGVGGKVFGAANRPCYLKETV